MSLSGHSQCLQIRTFSNIFANPGLITDTLLILALPSFRSLWLFPMSVLAFPPNCWSHSWASYNLVRPLTLRLFTNIPKASWMACAMHGMWCLIAGHTIPEASRVDCSSRVIKWFEEALSVVILSKRPSVSSIRSRTSFQCMASLATVCWPLT